MPPAFCSLTPPAAIVWLVLCAACAPSPATAFGQAAPRYVASREVILSVGGEAEAGDHIELWQQRSPAKSWEKAQFERRDAGSVLFKSELDGRFGIYFVLENDAGASGPPPSEETAPQISIICDTAPPTLQIRRAHALEDSGPREIELRMTVIEENLGPAGLSIFHRSDSSQSWKDGGTLKFAAAGEKLANLRVSWPVPDHLSGSADLMIVATDLAGNFSREEVKGVGLGPARVKAGRRASAEPPAAPQDSSEPKKIPIALSDPPLISEIDRQKVERLRNLASRYAHDDKYDLAGARFEEAIRTTPEDASLLSEFGTMLVRASRYDDARARFEEALRLAPRDFTAREGLALAAAGQRRYGDARDELRKLLADEPQTSRLWLRLGDLEYRLGNKSEAYDAWEKVLSAGNADISLTKTARERLKQLKR